MTPIEIIQQCEQVYKRLGITIPVITHLGRGRFKVGNHLFRSVDLILVIEASNYMIHCPKCVGTHDVTCALCEGIGIVSDATAKEYLLSTHKPITTSNDESTGVTIHKPHS